MIKRILFIASFLTAVSANYAQDLNPFLQQVSEYNPVIIAYQKLLEAKKIEARTGLTPSDPIFSFGVMPGNNPSGGTKKIWAVNQSFSFPTKYLLEKKISRNTINLAEQEFNLGKMQTLLDAHLTLFYFIYNQKSLKMLLHRKESYTNLSAAWEKMLSHGEVSILEYNKIIMELSSLNLDITRTEADLDMLKTRLSFIIGQNQLPESVNYPVPRKVDIDSLISEKYIFHPAYIIPEMEYNLSLNEIKLSRTGSLPEFQVGYSSEILPGETYSGPVAALSIPLWSNSHKIKTSVAKADHSVAVRDAELIRLKSELINEFSNMKALKKSLDEVSSILASVENQKYLTIALANGEISLTTYFSDLQSMYEIENRLLHLEYEYHVSMAKLFDHEYLKNNF